MYSDISVEDYRYVWLWIAILWMCVLGIFGICGDYVVLCIAV